MNTPNLCHTLTCKSQPLHLFYLSDKQQPFSPCRNGLQAKCNLQRDALRRPCGSDTRRVSRMSFVWLWKRDLCHMSVFFFLLQMIKHKICSYFTTKHHGRDDILWKISKCSTLFFFFFLPNSSCSSFVHLCFGTSFIFEYLVHIAYWHMDRFTLMVPTGSSKMVAYIQ